MRRIRNVLLGVVALVLLLAFGAWATMIWMPGSSWEEEMPPMEGDRQMLADQLEADVRILAESIGPRHVGRPEGLEASVEFLEAELRDVGYEPRRQTFEVQGVDCHNVEVEIEGATHPEKIVVIGAHYDSFRDTPAANDNGSGVAATLALARRFADANPERTLRFVFFVNEEPPWFQTDAMGSLRYARRADERGEEIAAMVSLETIGYFDDAPSSQEYPVDMLRWVYPDRGNFIGFVGNVSSRGILRQAIDAFRDEAEVPSHGASLPGFTPGVGWSDHWAFWQYDYPAFMVTDTAVFRYPHYHTVDDTPDQLDYPRMALVVEGMVPVVEALLKG